MAAGVVSKPLQMILGNVNKLRKAMCCRDQMSWKTFYSRRGKGRGLAIM